MNGQTRTQTYPGLFQSQAEDAFRRDAAEAAQHGWFPVSQQWNGQALVVTYAHGAPTGNAWAATPSGGQLAVAAQAPVVPAAVVVIGSAVAVAVGSFLPWGSVTTGFVRIEQSGMGGGDGWLFLILAGVLALGGWATLRGSTGRTWLTVLVASVIVVGAALYEFVDITRRSVSAILEYGVSIQTGPGILLILAAGVVASLASFGLRRRRTPRSVPAPASTAVRHQAASPSPLAVETARAPSEGTSPLLVLGVALVAVAIGGSAGMAMLGLGPFAGPGTSALATASPFVTPTPVVVVGSWSRADVISTLQAMGFDTTDPGEPWQGDYGTHSAIVHSADGMASRIAVIMTVPDDVDDATQEMGAITAILLASYAPDADDFVSQQLKRIGQGKKGGSKVFDDVKVTVDAEFGSDGWVLGLTFDHA